MANKTVVGGYPIEGILSSGDWLWFTGTKWTPIPYGTQGEIVTIITPPFKVVPILSNGYIVSIGNLKPGDVLCAVLTQIIDLNKEFEYITNMPFKVIDNRLRASNGKTSGMAINSVECGTSDAKSNQASSLNRSYNITLS